MAPANTLFSSSIQRPVLLALIALLSACAPGLKPLPLAPRPQPASPTEEPEAVVERSPASPLTADLEYLSARQLMVPVEGIRPSRIPDSFNESRGERVHRAVDIMAPRGTPVLAADDGQIFKLKRSPLGGITIYALDPSRRFIYYYAHLDHYRDDIYEGAPLAQGDLIGYVGTTGNAPKDTPHLHFQVMRMRTDGRYWDGEPVDPLPFLVKVGSEHATVVKGAGRATR